MKAFVTALLATLAATEDFNMQLAEISRELSVDAYCGRQKYDNLIWSGLVSGFVKTYTIWNSNNGTEGFIGYLPLNNSIYVVFKGSDDIENFVADLNTDKDPYHAWPECDCKVHDGFQNGADSVSGAVIAEVLRLLDIYPNAAVRTTGHSLGAALAQLTGMWLLKAGINVEQMINFGAPRVGDKDYASFSDSIWRDQFRMVNNDDWIPHLPPSYWPFDFYQTSEEVYEDKNGNYTMCGPGENPDCCDSHTFYSITDHLVYMDQCMGDLCGNCHTYDEVTQ
jgi:hypothetical protein